MNAEEHAPAFSLPNQNGDVVELTSLQGSWVVLYFYPKASTPGCTTQACEIRDNRSVYEELGVQIIGVSPDPVSRVKKFYEKEELNFTLLADEDHAVCERYGVWVEKKMYGKTYWGAQRSTFLINPEGSIKKIFPKVSPKTHGELVVKALKELL